jgi:hypothetical protein
MERHGEVYSPAMPLRRATLDLIALDLWNGAYSGTCHAVYSYGAFSNGGSFCREVTQEIAARLGEISFATAEAAKPAVRTFLAEMGIAWRDSGERSQEAPPVEAFAMVSPPEPAARAKRSPAKRRPRTPTPQELRAQPQFKLPIAGGKAASQAERLSRLALENERDEELGIEAVSLRDTRSLAEQKASWDRFRAMMRSWKADGIAEHISDASIGEGGSKRASG